STVEPYRAVERRLLIHQEVLQIVAEGLQVLVGREVFVRPGPRGNRVDDPADELLDAVLALGRSDLPAEIFRDDDVGRLLRPEFRYLDVALLEHQLAAIVADERRAQLPFHFVERIDIRVAEKSR